MVTSRADGCLDIWDLMDRSHHPSLQHNVGPEALTALEFWGDATLQLLAVGDKQGTLHILEIPRTLRKPVPNEQELVHALLHRQIASVRYLTTRMSFRQKELSLKEAEDEVRRGEAEAAAAKAANDEATARQAAEDQVVTPPILVCILPWCASFRASFLLLSSLLTSFPPSLPP